MAKDPFKKQAETPEPQPEALQSYKCHKEVKAAKIYSISGRYIFLGNVEQQQKLKVGEDYIEKHNPQEGGYYILYADGYESYSPAEPFEEGYTLIEEEAKAPE